MSKLILKNDGTPFATETAALSQRTKMGEEGQNTNVIQIEGGFALERKPEERRGKRVPIGTRQRLTVDKGKKDPGYEYRVVNDDEGRVEMFEKAGWEIDRSKVKIGDHQIGEATQMGSATVKSVGMGKKGILMRIKKEWYKADQDAKSEKIKESMRAIQREPEKPGNYGKIKIENP
jgi:hypothetical protein